jgi:acetyltransferase-like isoleucine patch superfamily enzyme/acyl carrier protein
VAMDVGAEVETLLRRSLATAGLRPVRTSGSGPEIDQLVAHGSDEELQQAWIAGHVYLRDQDSRISVRAEIAAKRLVIRTSVIESFASVVGEQIVIERSSIGRNSVMQGPLACIQSRIASHVIVGPNVVLYDTGIAELAKVCRFVRVEKSLVGSNSCIEGGTHPEKIPLGPLRRTLGVTIDRDCWIGQQVSITAGAALGKGVVVAAHTSITRPVPDFVLVAGNPPRRFPIDFAIRGLSSDEARTEGRLQGMFALDLPIFGPPKGAFRGPLMIELDYAQHGYLRGLASAKLIDFQRGVLDTTFAQLLPDHRIDIRARIGRTVRFELALDRPMPEALAFRRGSNAGMIVPEPEPKLLEHTWAWLLPRGAASLLPFEETEVDEPVVAPALVVNVQTIDIVTGFVRELLGKDLELDPDAAFFRLGLDSLSIAELASRIEDRFRIAAPDVFALATIRALAGEIDRTGGVP